MCAVFVFWELLVVVEQDKALLAVEELAHYEKHQPQACGYGNAEDDAEVVMELPYDRVEDGWAQPDGQQ